MSSNFGKALRVEREQRELSQQQLAEAAGLDTTVVALYEHGETAPQLDVLGALGRGLGVSLPEIVEWYVPPRARSSRGDDGGGGAG